MLTFGLLLVAGCATRSLNTPPPVVDWSTGSQGTRPSSVPVPTYTVRRDDTLASIAKRFNTTPAELAAWNNLGPSPRVRPDQVLRVSPPGAPAPGSDGNAPVATTQPIGSESVEQRPLGAEQGRVSPAGNTPPPSASNAPLKNGPVGLKRPYSDAALAELSRPDGDATSIASAAPTAAAPTIPPTTTTAAISWSWPAGGKPVASFADSKTKGIDIPGKAGDPVLAAADGKVTFAGTGVRGYGNFVIVRHSPELLSVYAHNRANLVKEGALVTKGQKIAEMGNSDTDAVKLHFEIRNDSKPVDPLKYLPEH